MKGSALSTEIAEPYAQALMSLAQDRNLTEQFGQDIRALLNLLQNSQDLRLFLESPVVQITDKKAVLERVVGEDSNNYLKRFLLLLIDKRRIVFLEEVCQQYLELLRKLTNTVLAEVTATTELSEEQRQSVAEKVKALTGAQAVEIKTSVDPDLLGGVVIKVGSQVYDASLRGQLRRISLSLSK
ncbi:F0F1 ATP synthase subunit delta [Aphanothece hegewaldii CCALA 016]|uniref:ATP synthase subunit delta n=1 Tax=Aphanothece hegewaldii CCALA 016 TaxID=2107694 RepID=A0A2T1LYK3_9CHRO|nr:ATP synthase F1 subunit delta [Aphanothece hegewaldii]PSF37473.1 F0F1 ATP synthase subunit delta [Aphanothece hegewaldii CCALA 016]